MAGANGLPSAPPYFVLGIDCFALRLRASLFPMVRGSVLRRVLRLILPGKILPDIRLNARTGAFYLAFPDIDLSRSLHSHALAVQGLLHPFHAVYACVEVGCCYGGIVVQPIHSITGAPNGLDKQSRQPKRCCSTGNTCMDVL